MAKLYNIEKTNEEIISFLNEHFKKNIENKKNRFNSTLSIIPSKKKILDFGCGWGQLAIEMMKKGNEVIGIDFQNEIDICNIYWKDEEEVNFSTQKITNFQDKSFDVVVSCQVAEHVHNAGNYFMEISRVLKNNGSLIITIPNIINPRFFLPHFNNKYDKRLKQISKKMLSSYDKGNDHINSWDPRHFVILMASLGFRLKEYKPTEGIPFPMKRPFTWINKSAKIDNWINKIPYFKNFSYTSLYEFVKEKQVTISNND